MNELERLIDLSEFDLDYQAHDPELDRLTRMTARICGAKISLVNLVDQYSQWTVSGHGTDIKQMPSEDSVCRFTIKKDTFLELKGLTEDPRFRDKNYVCGGPGLDYYYGIPLKTERGAKIGTLCVLDTETLELSQEQKELLEIVAHLVVGRLESIKRMKLLEEQLDEADKSKRKLGHDVRGPIAGIVGIIDILKENSKEGDLSELDEMLELIEGGGRGLLELTDNILNAGEHTLATYTCSMLASKLEKLCAPQALAKGVELSVMRPRSEATEQTHFSGSGLLQIGSNLINNAIKFTPHEGRVSVQVSLEQDAENPLNDLLLVVDDDGIGLSEKKIEEILLERSQSEAGTQGEKGYGFGLPLVKHLVKKAKGSLDIRSKLGEGCKIAVRLPV